MWRQVRVTLTAPIEGFGIAAAYAKALGLRSDNEALRDVTNEIYGDNDYMTKLAETSVHIVHIKAEAAA